jgi:hypothetical protein
MMTANRGLELGRIAAKHGGKVGQSSGGVLRGMVPRLGGPTLLPTPIDGLNQRLNLANQSIGICDPV